MARFKVGAQFGPQHCTMDELRASWRAAEALGVDTIWTWDHFFALEGDPDGPHFEGWSQLAAMACDTERVRFGMLVTCIGYRNPNLLADMARTVDHLSHGRLILGLGAGWFRRDYDEYGYPFTTAAERVRALAEAVPVIRERLGRLHPPPVGELPLMVGGGGEKVTLRLTAEHADIWNGFGPPDEFAHKNAVLNDWCATVGRDPGAIERSVLIEVDELDQLEAFVAAGAEHVILQLEAPFDMRAVERLLAARSASPAG